MISVADPEPDPRCIRTLLIVGLLDPDPQILTHGSGSLLFINNLRKFISIKFSILYFIMIYFLFDKKSFSVHKMKNVKVGSGSADSVIHDYGSTDPDPKEIFTDPQH
jgi:hypothetical protein